MVPDLESAIVSWYKGIFEDSSAHRQHLEFASYSSRWHRFVVWLLSEFEIMHFKSSELVSGRAIVIFLLNLCVCKLNATQFSDDLEDGRTSWFINRSKCLKWYIYFQPSKQLAKWIPVWIPNSCFLHRFSLALRTSKELHVHAVYIIGNSQV